MSGDQMGLAELTWSALDGFSRRLGIAPTSKTFAVALSGGPDSTALAHIFSRYVKTRFPGQERGRCVVVNHNLRPESASEAAVVAERAWRMGLEPTVRTLGLRSARQEVARRGRLLELMGAGLEHGGTCVLTAHNRSDQLETFVLRAMRASGVRGLAGIPPVSLLSLSAAGGGMRIAAVRGGGQESLRPPSEGEMYAFRPLLGAPKADLVDYCEDNGLDYVSDPTNADLSYTRNAIRAHFGTVGAGPICRDLGALSDLFSEVIVPRHSDRLRSMRAEAVLEFGDRNLKVDVEELRRHPRELVQDLLVDLVRHVAPRGGGRRAPRMRSIQRLQRLMYEGKPCDVHGISCRPENPRGVVYTFRRNLKDRSRR